MVFKQLLFSSAVIAALALSSCAEETQSTTTTTATEQAETDAILMNTSTAMPGAASAQSATVLSSPAGQSQSATQGSTQAAKTVAAAVNPPHGQPGHDCAVAVGAPLNSAAGTKAQSPPPQMQQPVKSPAPAATGSGRVNPPHGQPGHDCAVAVGAPLP